MENNSNNTSFADSVRGVMKTKAEIFYYDTIDSTNSEAKRHIASGLSSSALFVAKEQTSGKGRQGKPFFSPAETGLYMSVLVLPNSSFSDAVFLTTATAVAVCRAIESTTGIKTGIKWVNDIFYHGKKIGGILAEAINNYTSSTVEMAIIGIGINITTADFPKDILNSAGSLNSDVSREKLCAAIADEVFKIIALLPDRSFMEEYRERSVIIGKNITFCEKQKTNTGFVTGIDDLGGLIVDTQSGQVVLRSGEITVREQIDNS